MKSLAEISIIMPSVASSISTGNSNPPILCAAHEVDRQQQRDERAEQRQRLHEPGEIVVDERAIEGHALRPVADDQHDERNAEQRDRRTPSPTRPSARREGADQQQDEHRRGEDELGQDDRKGKGGRVSWSRQS